MKKYSPIPTRKPKRQILLVGDILVARDLLQILLVSEGFSVVAARSGKDARREITDRIFDLVIVDLIMPEMDGIEAVFALIGWQPALPIIALSSADARRASGSLGLAGTFWGANCRELARPFASAGLLTVIAELLAAGAPAPLQPLLHHA